MRYSQLLAVSGLSAFASAASRAAAPGLQSKQPGALRAPVRRVKTPDIRTSLSQARYLHAAAVHARQAGNASAPLPANVSNVLYGYEYIIDVQVGTPPQNVSLIFDTGSDETWVNPECDAFSHQAVCFAAGQYNGSDSSTAQNLSAPFSITYGSGSVEGWYFRDSFALAGAPASGVQFGVAQYSYNLDAGVLGLGYDSVVLDEFEGQGVVESKDFSISLGDSSSAQGEAVFGGVDTAKFWGPLQAIPMMDSSSFFSRNLHYQVNLTYMGVTSKGSCESTAATDTSFWGPAIVDTGSTISHLPFEAANQTAAMIPGARYDAYLQLWKVSCHYTGSADTVDFGFGDVVVSIPVREFIWRNIPAGGQCFLGMVADADSIGFSILGDSFLRALVALYQPDRRLLHLAPFSDCGTDVVSTQDDVAGSLRGRCEQPEWDTCTSRPTPVPLAAPTPSWTSLSWATPTLSDSPPLVSETDGFSEMWPLPLSSVVEPFTTELPVPTLDPVSVLTDAADTVVGGAATTAVYSITPATTKSYPDPVPTIDADCYETSLCVLALTTDDVAGVTANEDCVTYSTCEGAPSDQDATSTWTDWEDHATVIDPVPSLTEPYTVPGAPATGLPSVCPDVVYVTVTTTVGDLVPGCVDACTVA